MNKKTMLITAGIAVGVVGLGILIYHLANKNHSSKKSSLADPKKDRYRFPGKEVDENRYMKSDSPNTSKQENIEPALADEPIAAPDTETAIRSKEEQSNANQHSFIAVEKREEPEAMAMMTERVSTPATERQAPTVMDEPADEQQKEGHDRLVNHQLINLNHDEFPLRLGSKGPRVERLQVFLLRNYGLTNVNGVFDHQTEEQLKKKMNMTIMEEKTYDKYKMGNHIYRQVSIR